MLCLLIGLLISSCSERFINTRLAGDYQDTPYILTSKQPFEKVWSNTVDFFAQKGITITVIDKSSGLIVAGRTRFTKTYTFESNGKALDPEAFVIVNSCSVMMGYDFKNFKPYNVEGDWNVRIKEADGKTSININLVNLRAETFEKDTKGFPYPCTWELKSTGVFEKSLAGLFAGE